MWTSPLSLRFNYGIFVSNGNRTEWSTIREVIGRVIWNCEHDYPWIDLFSLYVLFSHFRPRDVLKGIFLLFLHNLCVHAHVHKTTFERNCSLEKAFVHYASIFSSILVRQKHWALLEHFSGIFLENNIFSSEKLKKKLFFSEKMKTKVQNSQKRQMPPW